MLLNKFDDIIELCRDHHIDLLCLTETWHDADSAVLGRLRCNGYNVVDRPRPRATGVDDLSVDHGDVLVMASADVSLSPIAVPDHPSTFETVCVRTVTDHFSAIVVVVYRPGSVASHSTTNWPPFWIALPSTKNRSSSSATSTFVWTATMTHTPINYAYWSIVTGSCFTTPGQLIS